MDVPPLWLSSDDSSLLFINGNFFGLERLRLSFWLWLHKVQNLQNCSANTLNVPDYTGPEDGLTSDLVDAAPNSHGWQESFPLFINDSIIVCPALISFSALIAHAFCQWLLHLDHTACLQITRPAVSELVPRTLRMKLELFAVFIDLVVGWFDLPLDRSQMSKPSLGIWQTLPSFKIRWPPVIEQCVCEPAGNFTSGHPITYARNLPPAWH